MKFALPLTFAMASLLVFSPLFAEDAPKKPKAGKGKQPSAAMLKRLEAAELTSEQREKIEGFAKELDTSMAQLREKGFSPDLNKKKADAMKKAKEAGKKGKELEATVMAELNLTEEQKAMMKEAGDAQLKFQKSVAEVLTAEQIEKLPNPMKQQMTRMKNGDKKPAKKKPVA